MIDYLLKSIIILGILTIAYKVIFTNSKHLELRRFMGLILPLIALWIPVIKHIEIINRGTINSINTIKTLQSINIESSINTFINFTQHTDYNNIIYFLISVSLLLLINFIIKLLKINRLKTKSILRDKNIYYTIGNHNPFSFLGNIYIPNKEKGNSDTEIIIKHEQIHLGQYHSIDILYLELVKIVFWFNPFLYILKNEILQVHEFLVDENITRDKHIVESYLNTILNYNFLKPISIANNFNQSFTRKRFIMMNKGDNSMFNAILKGSIMLIIVFTTIITTTQCNKEDTKEDIKTESQNRDLVEYKDLDVKPEFPKGNKALMKFLGENTIYPQLAKDKGVSVKCYIRFTISKDGDVSDVTIARFKQLAAAYDNKDKVVLELANQAIKDEAIRVVSSMPNWTPGEKDGKRVSVEYIVPLVFRIQ